jgi:Fic family protein
MARRPPTQKLDEIERVLQAHPDGMSAPEIAQALSESRSDRTLQNHLRRLVKDGRVLRLSSGRWTRYRTRPAADVGGAEGPTIPLSDRTAEIQRLVRRPVSAREPVGYRRQFLEGYRPNQTSYLTAAQRSQLARVITRPSDAAQPAGTYARTILNRLLIDLSWNSSRLEGNTYSLLDTRRLIEFGQQAEGRDQAEAQMILNHKDAIEFLAENAADIGFNRYTILNLHGILANNLLADAGAAGRLRHIGVGIGGSVYHPPETPQLIEECFTQLLATASAIDDPFEQAFFAMVHLPYLQPFDDVNKRVSRLAANIPFIKGNLSPLSFTEVPRDLYTQAMLGVYELNRTELLRDVFIWAYERSAARYTAIQQSLGEPDPFRLRYRDALRTLIGDIVRAGLGRASAARRIAAWTDDHIDEADRGAFQTAAEDELLALHEGNFARYGLRPAEFKAWRVAWEPGQRGIAG